MILALLFLVGCQKCSTTYKKTSGFTKEDIKGSWYLLESDSTYWEVFYSDSLCWSYEFGLGLIVRKYQIRNDSIMYYYLTDEVEHRAKIESMWPDSMAVIFGTIDDPRKGIRHKLHIPIPIDDGALLAGDTTAVYNYFEGYRRRAEEVWMRVDSVRK